MSTKTASTREDHMEVEESKNEDETATNEENIIKSSTSREENKSPAVEEIEDPPTPQKINEPADGNKEMTMSAAVEEEKAVEEVSEEVDVDQAVVVVKKKRGALKKQEIGEESVRENSEKISAGAEDWPEMKDKQAEVAEEVEKASIVVEVDVEATPEVKKKRGALLKDKSVDNEGGRKRSLRKMGKITPAKMDVVLKKNGSEDEELENTQSVATEDAKKARTKAGRPLSIVEKKLEASKEVVAAKDDFVFDKEVKVGKPEDVKDSNVDEDDEEAVGVNASTTEDVAENMNILKNFLPGLTVTAVPTEEVELKEETSRREENKQQKFPPGLVVTAVSMKEERKEEMGEEVQVQKPKEEGELEEEARTPAILEAPKSPAVLEAMFLLEAPESPVVLGAMGLPLHSPGRMACPLQVCHF